MEPTLTERVERGMASVSRWCEKRLAEGVRDGHNYGRAVDALLKGQQVCDAAPAAELVDGLRDMLLDLTDNPLAFSRDHEVIDPHDLRETLQALTELSYTRGDEACRQRLDTLLSSLLRLTHADGTWRADGVAAEPLLTAPGFRDELDADASSPPRARSRMIMALTHLYRLSGDDRALELAHRFVRLARERAFEEDGRLTTLAGIHTHSITGTVHGLADFAWLTGDRDALAHARRIFDVGLPSTCSSFGWSIESIGHERIPGRGEINNTGDMIQACIYFGLAGHSRYFETAERMLRSHLLPSQWPRGQEICSPADPPKNAVVAFPDESDGGWGCGTPSDRHLPDPLFVAASILDITQGGIQCLWTVLQHAISQHPPMRGDVRLNLFLPSDRAAADTVDGGATGELTVTMPSAGRLWIRTPSWLGDGAIGARTSGGELPTSSLGGWNVTPHLTAGVAVDVSVPQPARVEEEWVYRQKFRMRYEGDTIVAMSPRGTYAPMFPVLD